MVNICNAAATWAVNANSALFGSVGNAFKKFSDGPCNPIFSLFASEATYVELKLPTIPTHMYVPTARMYAKTKFRMLFLLFLFVLSTGTTAWCTKKAELHAPKSVATPRNAALPPRLGKKCLGATTFSTTRLCRRTNATRYVVNAGPNADSFTKTSADVLVDMPKSIKATITEAVLGVKQSPFNDDRHVIVF